MYSDVLKRIVGENTKGWKICNYKDDIYQLEMAPFLEKMYLEIIEKLDEIGQSQLKHYVEWDIFFDNFTLADFDWNMHIIDDAVYYLKYEEESIS